jgi:hypothetical protein
MVAHRTYWSGFRESSSGRTNLLYFAAAVPAVGFVHRAADVNPLDAATVEGYAERRFIDVPQSSRRWPLGLRWFGGADGGPSLRLSARPQVWG